MKKGSLFLFTALVLNLFGCGSSSNSSSPSSQSRHWIVDSQNHRVLLYNQVPTPGVSPSVVLGQPDLTSNSVNNGGISAQSMNEPVSAHYDGQRFFVADGLNNRVLVWNSWPTQNQQAADLVIGQPNMTTNTAGTSSSVFDYPVSVYSNGSRLFVADNGNNRILIWNSLPTANGAAANLVLGQPNMTSGAANGGGAVAANTFFNPWLKSDGTRLFVSDYENHRVLIFNTLPTASPTNADVVIGQTSMSLGSSGTTQSRLFNPWGLSVSSSGALAVAEYSNHRVLIWDSIPTTNGVAASRVLGQANFTTNNMGLSASEFSGPNHVEFIGNALYVADTDNSRILIWDSVPSNNGQAADRVLGQANFTSDASGVGDDRLNFPFQIQ